MKHIVKSLALLAIPVAVWLAVFIAFEPNNYFGLKAAASSTQPVARVRWPACGNTRPTPAAACCWATAA